MKSKIILKNSRKKSYNSALERYRKKKRKELIYLISIISTVLLAIIVFNSPLMNVKEVNVEGLVQLEKNVLVEKAGLNSDVKIWKISEEEIEKKIQENFNIISKVDVESRFLNNLNITVQEKKILAQEKSQDGYIKLLEDGQEYTGKVAQSTYLPVLDNFENHSTEKLEVLKSLTELNSSVLYKISEISYDETDKKIANVYMRDGQRVKINLVNFSSKLNYYNQIEKFIEDKSSTVLNLVNGAYLETTTSEKEKVEKVNALLASNLETANISKETTTVTSQKQP